MPVPDEGFERIQDLLPIQSRGGNLTDHRTVLNGIFWVLNSDAQCHDMPQRYGKRATVYGRYRRPPCTQSRAGLFDRILERLQVSLDHQGRIAWSVSM